MTLTDAELVTRAQEGNPDAFAVLVERHRDAIIRLLRRFVTSADDAQDLAQETFVSAFQHLSALRDGARFGPWLRRIALNAARQWWRHEACASLETLRDESAITGSNGSHAFDAGLERVREHVHDSLASLAPAGRSVVLLHYFDGFDYEETAALLDVPVSTVRGRLHLARRKLREEMAELARAKSKTEQRR